MHKVFIPRAIRSRFGTAADAMAGQSGRSGAGVQIGQESGMQLKWRIFSAPGFHRSGGEAARAAPSSFETALSRLLRMRASVPPLLILRRPRGGRLEGPTAAVHKVFIPGGASGPVATRWEGEGAPRHPVPLRHGGRRHGRRHRHRHVVASAGGGMPARLGGGLGAGPPWRVRRFHRRRREPADALDPARPVH